MPGPRIFVTWPMEPEARAILEWAGGVVNPEAWPAS